MSNLVLRKKNEMCFSNAEHDKKILMGEGKDTCLMLVSPVNIFPVDIFTKPRNVVW